MATKLLAIGSQSLVTAAQLPGRGGADHQLLHAASSLYRTARRHLDGAVGASPPAAVCCAEAALPQY